MPVAADSRWPFEVEFMPKTIIAQVVENS
jgi:hypothetical protein